MNDSTSRSIAIRSLRRRLWRALQQEDVDTAIRCYTSTRADYNAWILEEERELQLQQEHDEQARFAQRDARPFKKLGTLKLKRSSSQKRRNSSKQNIMSALQTADPATMMGTDMNDTDYLLIQEMDASSMFVADDFLSPAAPYEDVNDATARNVKSSRRKSKGPRFAGFFGRRDESTDDQYEDQDNEEEGNDELLTTPLHEAARLGSAKLVRLFLEHGGSPNVKNGMQRTALHMAAGGLTEEEERLLIARAAEQCHDDPENVMDDVGIRAPIVESQQSNTDDSDDHPAAVGAKKAALAVRRLFALGNDSDKNTEDEMVREEPTPPFDSNRLNKLIAQRMDTVLAILSWCHPDDGSSLANEGPSINSVDARGRTGLHYAAELGRASICMAIVSSFGCMLTIVDERSRTPCELAGEQAHSDLAAQLEARALLYADPYGVDDELMASVLSEERDDGEEESGQNCPPSHRKLAIPFSWFETLSTVQVRQERNARTEKAMMKLQMILAEREEQEKANNVMFNYDMNDSLDTAPQVSIEASDDDEDEDDNGDASEDSHSSADESCHLVEELNECHPSSPSSHKMHEDIVKEKGEGTRMDGITNVDVPRVVQEAQDEILTPDPSTVSSGKTVDGRVETLTGLQEDHPPSPPFATANKTETDLPFASNATAPMMRSPVNNSENTRLLESIQESHVEKFLTFHNWELDKATMAFRNDPVKALADAGVSVPFYKTSLKWEEMVPQTCLICFEERTEMRGCRGCDHEFCEQCVSDYIADCARSRNGGIAVVCPHHECGVSFTQSELQSFVPNPSVYESLLEAADENFVASTSDMKFCPHPGCEGVVRRLVPPIVSQEGFDHDIIDISGAVCVSYPEGESDAPHTYEGCCDERYEMTVGSTQPHAAHRFCFACGDSVIHWPVPCQTLEDWKTKVQDEINEIDDDEGSEQNGSYEDVAQRLWMKANTRPCPKCKVPIEKNEGCNHMTCTNRHCRHEFCWICRKDWKLHNSETGGFFRCNRWEGEQDHEFYDGEEHKPRQRTEDSEGTEANEGSENGYGSALHSSRVAFKKATEMKRFLHHFSRWSAHKESAALEKKMAMTVCVRMAPVVDAAVEFTGTADFDFGGKGLSFIHAAFTELLECRSLLQHSYAFAFFRYPTLYYIRRNRVVKLRQRERATFEQFQSELEMMTEQMSDIVARAHLRATQTQIMFLTNEAAQKRSDFSSFLITVLDDERKEKATNQRNEGTTATSNVPPPIDVTGIMDRLQHRVPLRNEHDDMDSDDGVTVPYVSRRLHLQEEEDDDEDELGLDTAMQEALRASLLTFNAESASLSADGTGGEDGGEEGSLTEWSCGACTFVNSRGMACEMCGTSRNDSGDNNHTVRHE